MSEYVRPYDETQFFRLLLRLRKAEELIADAYFDDYCIALYWDEENSEYRFDYDGEDEA